MADDHCDLLCLDLPHAEQVRAKLPDSDRIVAAASRARALADPSRLRVALALHEGGELCVCDLAWICGMPQNLTSHHVRKLRLAGLAQSRRAGNLVMYSLTPAGVHLVASTACCSVAGSEQCS